MRFWDIILYLVLGYFVYYIVKANNLLGIGKSTKKAKEEVRQEKVKLRKKNRSLWVLKKLEWVALNIGFAPSEYKLKKYKFKLDRLRWKVKSLDRTIKPLEFIGLLKFLMMFGVFVWAVGYILTGKAFFFVFLIFLLFPALFNIFADMVIMDEDAELERDFPDLYMVLYSRLLQRSHARLAPVLRDYSRTLDVMHGGNCDNAIKRFVTELRNNIEIYGDDSLAVMKLREKYTSVMIVNFCNLAVQALRGVDNSDKLLSFKIELSQKRIEQMKKRADKLVARGRRAVYVLYLILFQFILLSWIAKLSVAGGIRSIIGF